MERIMQPDTATGSHGAAGHYSADELGAPFKVYLEKGYKVERRLGDEFVTITDLPGLIAAVVQTRVMHPRKLSGEELKFIRTALRIKSKEVADLIDLSPEHYSRCESGEKTLSPNTEKAYRVIVYLHSFVKDRAVQEVLNLKTLPEPHEISSGQAKEALTAFMKVFMEMKIKPVAPADEKLEFWFTRRSPNKTEWKKVELAEAV